MRKFLLMAMFLAACSSAPTRRTDYCDGVEVCPPEAFTHPGYAPAGAGLPEYRPTEEEPEVPRGKDRRVLPATREPGIWASDGDPKQNGKVVPLFPERGPTESPVSEECRRELALASVKAGVEEARQNLPRDERACVTARLFYDCASAELDALQRGKTVGLSGDRWIPEKVKERHEAARRYLRRACKDMPQTMERADVWMKIRTAFDEITEIPK